MFVSHYVANVQAYIPKQKWHVSIGSEFGIVLMYIPRCTCVLGTQKATKSIPRLPHATCRLHLGQDFSPTPS